MWERFKPNLSFANVVAALALFVALGGTVYAANKINGKQIKPNSIPGNRIKKGTLAGTQIQRRVRWAIVDSGGNIVGQSGGISNTAHDPGSCTPGCDFLDFGSSQAGKAIIVTPSPGYSGEVAVAGVCGGVSNPGGTPCSVGNNTRHILVLSKTLAGAPTNGGYYIAVIG